MKNSQGQTVSVAEQAEVFATYLSSKHWAPPTIAAPQDLDPIGEPPAFDLSPFTDAELKVVLKAIKTRKAAGPDKIPA